MLVMSRARAAILESDTGEENNVRSPPIAKRRLARGSGIAAQISGRSRNGDSARKTGPKIHGARKYI
jgi:hypothetical protein